MGDLEQVVKALKNLLNDGNDSNKSKDSPNPSDSSASNESDDATLDVTTVDTQPFFCFEDSLPAKTVKVSVNDVGSLSFPIKEDVIEKLIGKSEKAKLGEGHETVLDTSYRDTQTIPAAKVKVDIDQEVLNNLLQHLRQAFNVEDYTKLEIHLNNMLIYGPGQFFQMQDTEKALNVIATLVMVLPSPHKGGDLVIQHCSSKHRFFGSLYHDIIKFIAFYSDCYYEVKEVNEGYRVALTYDVEIKSGPIPDLISVDENLKDAVNNYFEETGSHMLVYYLDHEYTENSLRWYMLKGADQICGKALLAVGKLESYSPCLALVEYHNSWIHDEAYTKDSYTKLYFWIDENNISLKFKKISVSENKICFMKDTKSEFEPYKREEKHEEDWSGDEVECGEWYHRSAVVLWRDSWAFLHRYKKKFYDLHQLCAQPNMQSVLLQKIKENSDNFFVYLYWKDENVTKMGLEVMIYLNDKEITSKILSKCNISEVFGSTKYKIRIATNCDIENWKTVIKAWESTQSLENLMDYLLPFLLDYVTREDKDLGVAGYLLDEIAKFFLSLNAEKLSYYGWSMELGFLCSLLQICFQLGKLDVEEKLVKNTDFRCSTGYFHFIQKKLHPTQFARILGDVLLKMINAVLRGEEDEEKYIYARENPYLPFKKSYIQKIFSLLEECRQMGNKAIAIFYRKMCDANCTASLLADFLIKLKEVSREYVSNCTDFKNYALNKIQAELEELENRNIYYLAFNCPCSCEHCILVQRFIASEATEITIPEVDDMLTTICLHIRDSFIYTKYYRGFTYLPIDVDTIQSDSHDKD